MLIARVSRIPLSSNYNLTVLQTGAVAKIGLRNDGLTGKKEVQEPLPSGRTVALRQDDVFIFMGNTRLAWEQPALKKILKKK